MRKRPRLRRKREGDIEMYKDFEGRTEAEALESARTLLDLGENDDVYVEVLEQSKKGFFKKSYVKIRVYYGESTEEEMASSEEVVATPGESLEAENDNERKIVTFLDTLIRKMGYEADIKISFRKDMKLGLDIESDSSSILIGRKGKNLDAIQLLVNVYAANLDEDLKVVIDSENYRMRHEEAIVRNACKAAEYVKRSGRSKLLEPMNPFERRLIHTALNDIEGVDTKSEGEGLYKQVRIIPVKNR